MSKERSLEKAAQAWCTEKTSHLTMIPELAGAFAEILEAVWNQPWLGNATTRELLEELTARIEVSGELEYKPLLILTDMAASEGREDGEV